MPSPFPGMDPFLEAPDVWPDLHEALASQIRAALNRRLPPPYYARLEMRPEVGIIAGPTIRRVVPDIAVAGTGRTPPARVGPGNFTRGATALAERPRTEPSPGYEVEVQTESIRHPYVEIRDPTRGHALVTLIELASPTNKRPGPDREAYAAKQREVLASDASLVQIDLLRAGTLPLPDEMAEAIADRFVPPPDYAVLVHRGWEKFGPGSCKFMAYPASVREQLPCVPIPLRKGEPEVALDLQHALDQAYDEGPYARGAVDYTGTPDPPLRPDDLEWAKGLLRGSDLGA